MFDRIVQPTNANVAALPKTYPGRRIGTPAGLGIGIGLGKGKRCPYCGLRKCNGHTRLKRY